MALNVNYLLLHGGLALLRLPCFLLGRGRSLYGCRLLLLLLLHLKQLLDLHLGEGRRQHRPTWSRRERGRRQQGRLNAFWFQLTEEKVRVCSMVKVETGQ